MLNGASPNSVRALVGHSPAVIGRPLAENAVISAWFAPGDLLLPWQEVATRAVRDGCGIAPLAMRATLG